MKRSVHYVIMFVFVLAGCSTTSMMQLTPEEQDYLEKAKGTPLTVKIQEDEADEAWGRAQSFVGKFSSMKIQNSTDYVIQTYNPATGDPNFGYNIVKSVNGDEVEIQVSCLTGNMFSTKDADQNAHIAAYYIKTGELESTRLISR